ncbi:MAG: LamG domain-containing protein [Verrucomicrobiota bacterium]
MKASKFGLCCVLISIFFSGSLSGAFATDTNPPPYLTVELRDGSRVIGQSLESTIRFHSTLLGDLKLEVKDVRSIDCVSSNTAKLTAANGDELSGWFVNPRIRVGTSFGKVELSVDSIRKLTVLVAGLKGQKRPGLVALWSGEGDGNDSAGGNTATLTDISFAEGKVGQAFSFNGTSSYFKIPYNPALNVGKGEGLTISAWIKPSDVNGLHPILEWNPSETMPGVIGVQLWIGQNPSSRGVLCGFFMDTNGNNYVQIPSPGRTLVANAWQHIAVTYSQASGILGLYVNGKSVSKLQWGSFVPLTKGNLLSFRPSNPGDWTYNRFFVGLMDELAIYNRALSASEIQAICTEQNNGEPLPPPPTSAPGMTPFNGIYRDSSSE